MTYRRRVNCISPEEKEFFNNMSKKYDVIIIPQILKRPKLFIGMRRCIDDEYLNKMRICENYFNNRESIPEGFTLESYYEHIFEEMYNELKQGYGLKERDINGITDWYVEKKDGISNE